MLFTFSVYAFATCPSDVKTNATGLLSLSHNVCPSLFSTDTSKERATITYYDNNYTSPLDGRTISITIDGKVFRQDWITNLPITLNHLRTRINSDGKFTAISSSPRIIITSKETGYKVDALATGGTPTNSLGQFAAQEVNTTRFGLREGSDSIAEVVVFDINGSSGANDIKFGTTEITNIRLFVNGVEGTGGTIITGTPSFDELYARLEELANNNGNPIATLSDTSGVVTVTSLIVGAITPIQIVLDHNASGTLITNTIGNTGTSTRIVSVAGRDAIASIKRLYYYGNEGNYSIKFFPYRTIDTDNLNTSIYTIETPYLGTLSQTLNYLDGLVDANGTYSSSVVILANDHGYLRLVDKTPRDTNYTLAGKSGNGNAKVVTNIQGKATPVDINMTYMSYNDNFLYTTFDIDYDVDESDADYSSAKQDILEIFEVTHADNPDNIPINTLNLKSVEVLRHYYNVASVVSVNDIVFLGDDNSSYYNFDRKNQKKLTQPKKLNETSEILNVASNMAEYYQDGDDGYVFLADNKIMRIYKVDKFNKVTHYKARYNSMQISDINRDGQYLYVQAGNKLTQFLILSENNKFSIEYSKDFVLDADKIYVRGDYIYYTMSSGGGVKNGYSGKIVGDKIESKKKVESSEISFMIGDEFYSASIGMDGLKIYNYKNEVNATDNAYSGSRILVLGEYIITDDLNSSYIRIYKFGDVSVSSLKGEGSLAKPFNVKMKTNKINLDDVNWTIWKIGEPVRANLKQKNPTFPFTETGLWFVKATVTYQNYPYPSEYRYRIDVIEDNAPGVEIHASSIAGLKGLKVDFTSTITKNSYVDSVIWDFNDSDKTTFILATSFLRNPSWVFNNAGEHNVTFVVFYDRDKNITKNIIINISELLEINTANSEGINTATHIIGQDINFSVDIEGNADFFTTTNEEFGGDPTPRKIRAYDWDFGDNHTLSTLENPQFNYTQAGSYTISVKITRDEDNATFTAKKTISVVNLQEPTIMADKISGEAPLTVNFNVSLKGYLVKDIRPISILWQFTRTDTSPQQNPTFIFKDPDVNEYTVRASIKLSDGNTLELQRVITINNKVSLDIKADTLEGYTPLTVRFEANSSAFSGINRYDWEIGIIGKEKVKKTGNPLEYTFDINGTYEINATAFSNKNHKDTDSLIIKVAKGPSITIKGELVSFINRPIYRFTAMKEVGDTSFADENTSWIINGKEEASKTSSMSYEFHISQAYKIEFKVILSNGDIVKYVYDRNPTFNPYFKKVQLYAGWNLMSSPLDEKIEIIPPNNDTAPQQATGSLQRLRNISSIIWTFTDTWHKNPDVIDKKIGFWIKATMDRELIFDGNTYYVPDLTSLTPRSWYLLGTGKRLENYKTIHASIDILWAYKKGKWYKNPSIIDAGDGIWIKLK